AGLARSCAELAVCVHSPAHHDGGGCYATRVGPAVTDCAEGEPARNRNGGQLVTADRALAKLTSVVQPPTVRCAGGHQRAGVLAARSQTDVARPEPQP